MTVKSSNSIPPVENFDPIGNFVRKTLGLSPLAFGLLLFVADVLIDGYLGWRYDIFLTTSESSIPGLLQDLTALVTDFASIPIIGGLYLWTPAGATRVFRQLRKERVFKSDTWLTANLSKSRPYFCSRLAFYVVLVISLVYTLSQLGANLGWVPWRSAGGYLELHPPMSFARAPFWFLGFYTMLYGMFNVGVTIITLRRMFRTKDIQLLPLHPDRCGGLESISQYSVRIGLGIAALGLVISAATVYALQQGTLLTAYLILAGIVAYIVLAPLFFFWPLGTAHEAMQDAKDAELLSLAKQFDNLYNRLKQEGINQDHVYENDMKRLDHLRKLYQHAQEFPVWPFDVKNVRRFFAIVTAPVVPALVSVATDAIGNLISF